MEILKNTTSRYVKLFVSLSYFCPNTFILTKWVIRELVCVLCDFFNPKLKQTKVRQVELNRLSDRGKKNLCFHYKMLRGMKNKINQTNKKTGGTLSQTFNEHFYSERFVWCDRQRGCDFTKWSGSNWQLTQSFPMIPSELGSGVHRTLKRNHHILFVMTAAGGMSDSAQRRGAALMYFLLPSNPPGSVGEICWKTLALQQCTLTVGLVQLSQLCTP